MVSDDNHSCDLPQIMNVDLKLDLFSDESDNRTLLNCIDMDPDHNYFTSITCDNSYSTPLSLRPKFTSPSLSFSAMHINCRSLLPKLGEIRDLLALLPVSILALTETWLDGSSDDAIKVPGYQFVHKPRGGHGGRVAFLIKDDISFQLLDHSKHNLPSSSYEGLFISVSHKRGTTLMGVIYRPPGHNLDEFSNEIDFLLSEILKKNKEVLLLGDFNIDLLKVNNHKVTTNFYNCMTAHHFLPVI